MQAAVLYGPGDFKLVDKSVPRPGPGEALVKVEFCGICGSDIHAYHTGFLPAGITIGHEYAGIIAAVGPGCGEGSLQPGQRVTGNNIIGCRECANCRRGRDHHCSGMRRLGVTEDGAMAEYILAPLEALYPLPEEVPLELGTLAEPLSVALHGINLAGIKGGDSALILGAGAIGLCVLAALRQRGVDNVMVVEPNRERTGTAAAMGARAVFSPVHEGLSAEISRLSEGDGAGFTFECAGLPATILEAANLTRSGGAAVIMGICYEPVEINFLSLVTREIRLVTACGKTGAEFRQAAALIASRQVDLAPLATRILPLEKAAETFTSPPAGIKTILQITRSARHF